MKNFMYIVVMMSSFSVYAYCEDPQSGGYDTMGQSNTMGPSNGSDERA